MQTAQRLLSLPTVMKYAGIGMFVGLMLLVGMIGGTSSARAFSASSTSACAVHLVRLNGQRPAITSCIKYGNVNPNINGDSCADVSNLSAEIKTSSMGTWCYAGVGYTGLNPNLHNVTSVYGWHCAYGWILQYNSGNGQKSYFDDYGVYQGTRPPYGDVTQLDVTSGYAC